MRYEPSAISRLLCASTLALTFGACLAGTAAARTAFDGRWSVVIYTQRGTCDAAYRSGVQIQNGIIFPDASRINWNGLARRGRARQRVRGRPNGQWLWPAVAQFRRRYVAGRRQSGRMLRHVEGRTPTVNCYVTEAGIFRNRGGTRPCLTDLKADLDRTISWRRAGWLQITQILTAETRRFPSAKKAHWQASDSGRAWAFRT